MQEFLQRIYDNGFIELGQYTGLYCVSCEDYYTADQLVDGKCPVHGRPVIEMQEDNYFFRLSAFEQPLLDYYENHPDFVRPNAKRNEALGFIRGGLNDVSITRTSFRWGVPVPWDDAPRLLCLVRRADQLPHGGVLRERPGSVRIAVGGGSPLDRQGHLEVPLRVVARHVHGGRHRPAPGDLRARVPPHGRAEAREDDDPVGRDRPGRRGRPLKITEVSPLALADEFGVDPLRYHLLRDVPLGGDGDFSYEGIVGRYNADLANNLGNLLSRVATVVHSKCGGIGPAPDPDSPLASECGRGAAAPALTRWARWAPHEALEATWRLIGATNAELEAAEPWKMEPGPAVDAVLGNALEVLRIVAILLSPAMPSTAAEIWRRIGVEGDPTAVRLPERRPWGGVPRRGARGEGRSPLPAAQGMSGWFDSHCHVQEEYLGGDEGGTASRSLGVLERAGAAGVDRLVCIGTDASTSAQAVDRGAWRARQWRRAHARGPPSGCTRTRRPPVSTGWPHCSREECAVGDGVVVAVGECGLDYYYEHSPRAAQRAAFAAQIALGSRVRVWHW